MIAVTLACLNRLATWLTLRRIRAQAIILLVCLWSAALVDFSNVGLQDRSGNIKFQDFLVFYTSGKLVMQHHSDQLFDPQVQSREIQAVLGRPTQIQLPNMYGPQVGFVFSLFGRMPFLSAALTWIMISMAIYLFVCFRMWQSCAALHDVRWTVVLLVFAFPPFFHFVVRGQLSSLILLCFAGAFYAFQSKYDWLAGFVLGLLIFKPQFMIGLVMIMLAAGAWKTLVGIVIGGLAQIGASWAYFGSAVMRTYVVTLLHLPVSNLEPGISQTQMHSLRSFWMLAIPNEAVSAAFHVGASIAVLYVAAKAWKCSGPLALRFSVLLLATVLVNPHLFVYDLLALAPIFFLTTDWMLWHSEHALSQAIKALLYLAFLLPLFGPLAIWTHVQISVIAFAGLLIALASVLKEESRQLAELKAQ
jgi:hypothetical protein